MYSMYSIVPTYVQYVQYSTYLCTVCICLCTATNLPHTRLDDEVRQLRAELLAAPKVDHLQRCVYSSLV